MTIIRILPLLKKRYDKLSEQKISYDSYVNDDCVTAFISEHGGIWFAESDVLDWGYGEYPKSLNEMIERYRGLTEALLNNPLICAFCYMQLTEVEQEQNRLYTYDRKTKMNPAIIKAINTQKADVEE